MPKVKSSEKSIDAWNAWNIMFRAPTTCTCSTQLYPSGIYNWMEHASSQRSARSMFHLKTRVPEHVAEHVE